MKGTKEQGSVLVLVLFGVIILTLIGVTGLRHTTGELAIARNFMSDKTAFFTAESGIQFGINELRNTINPAAISFETTTGSALYKSGEMTDLAAQYINGFLGFPAPMPKGMSIEMSGTSGVVPTAWDLVVSSKFPANSAHPARKEIRSVILLLSAEY